MNNLNLTQMPESGSPEGESDPTSIAGSQRLLRSGGDVVAIAAYCNDHETHTIQHPGPGPGHTALICGHCQTEIEQILIPNLSENMYWFGRMNQDVPFPLRSLMLCLVFCALGVSVALLLS